MNDARCTVSVIVPAFNAARTIGSALRSVLAQDGVDLEVLVGDDASSDDTVAVVEGIGDPRVRVLRNASNLGPGPTRDRLIPGARGRWIAFIDADDEWQPGRLQAMLAAAGNDESLVVFDDVEECHDTPAGLVPWRRLRGPDGFSAGGVPTRVDTPAFVRGRSMLVKLMFARSLCLRSTAMHGALPFGEDVAFLLALLAGGGQLLYVPRAMYRYRISPGSATSSTGRFSALAAVLEDSLARFEGRPATQAALREKIRRVRRQEARIAFTGALRSGRFLDGAGILLGSPSLVHELLRHNLRMFPYHLHRLAHGAPPRRARGRHGEDGQ